MKLKCLIPLQFDNLPLNNNQYNKIARRRFSLQSAESQVIELFNEGKRISIEKALQNLNHEIYYYVSFEDDPQGTTPEVIGFHNIKIEYDNSPC